MERSLKVLAVVLGVATSVFLAANAHFYLRYYASGDFPISVFGWARFVNDANLVLMSVSFIAVIVSAVRFRDRLLAFAAIFVVSALIYYFMHGKLTPL